MDVHGSLQSSKRRISQREHIFETVHSPEFQLSTSNHNRTGLNNLLERSRSNDHIFDEWMNLMEEQCQTEQITIESFRVLLSAISEYLKGLTRNLLENTQNETTHDLQIDFQRAFDYFIKSCY
ncbi:unnamed protein product [Rotaria sordida]|uniref:Uncharacterized protein n=1 Tax=Rotaria sordida TaxID=392033 RepID=A0A815RIK8_9BILA|nr:unnamed protein product [Rotaria sordida]CAF1478099.1 unnamed protein product [Rotaria sordida]CAF1480527.1 unnamed protein product [Rotaria sordida]